MNLDAWRARPMTVRVLEICPVCETLAEGVQRRTFQVKWWLKKDETCCTACVPAVEAGLKDEVILG
jgi:hypothetical protein